VNTMRLFLDARHSNTGKFIRW